MAFLNIKKVTLKNEYTMEELYDAIKAHEFAAGKPVLAKHGATKLVAFAPINKDNQIVINPGSMKQRMNVFRVLIMPEVGVANFIINTAINELTDDWALLINSLGKNVKNYRKLVDVIADELVELGL